MSENKETYEKRRSLVNMSCSDLCIDYIKKTESILRNGYYHDHGAFYLLTYNSGGKEGLDVKQTINMNLTRSLSELMDVPEYFISGTILTHYQEARRFDTIDILSELEGKKIIIADRDLVVCSNIDSEMFSSIKEWANGGEVKKVDMKKPSCSDFIKGSESILRNGYYSDHELFYLITYNSGGGKGINVYQTVDYNLVDKLAFFLGFSDTTVDVTLLKHYEEARRFDSLNILKEIKDKPVIIVDRDTIVCSDYDRKTEKFKDGGELNKSEMITQEKITLYSVQYGTDDWTETKGSLTPDLSDAEYYYKIIGSSDLDGKKGYKQLIKQENEYKFVYNLDEEETADDYPLSEYWNDDSVWSLVSEGEHEVEKSEDIDDVNKSSEELLSLVEQHYKKEYSGGYKYKNIPVYSDELDEDGEQIEVGCLQLRIANHSENVSNIDRFGSCDYYLSVVISNQDPTRGRFGQSMYERRRNEKEIYFDSGSDFDEVISEIDDEIEEAMNYVKDKNSATFKMGGEVNKETSDIINEYYQDLIKRNLAVDLADYKLKKYLKENNATTNDGLVKSYITSEPEYQKLNSEYKAEFKKMQDANKVASVKFKKLSHIDRQKAIKMYNEYFKKVLAEETKMDNKIFIPNNMISEIKESIKLGYNKLQEGMISKNTRGVMLVNDNYEVRGTYAMPLKGAIEKIISESQIDQLSKGTEVELEHKGTIEKIASGELSAEEGAKEIAKDHITEDPQYYDKLEKVESKTPIKELGTGSKVYFETPFYRVNEYSGGNLNDRFIFTMKAKDDQYGVPLFEHFFDDIDIALFVAEKISKIYPNGVPEAALIHRIIKDISGEYKEKQENNMNSTNNELTGVKSIIVNESRPFSNWNEANESTKWLISQQVWSNLPYKIEFQDGFILEGTIDAEPYSFWKDKKNPLTWHLNTFWGNFARATANPIYDQESIDYAKKVVTKYNIGQDISTDVDNSDVTPPESEDAEVVSSAKQDVIKKLLKEKKTAYNFVYDRLLKVAPDLLRLLNEAEYTSDVYGKSQYRTQDFGGNDALMYLAIEGLDKDEQGRYELSISHYYKQHGDMMCDPCMTVRLDPELKTVEALTFKMDGIIGRGIIKSVYGTTKEGKPGVNIYEKKDQNSFLNKWSSNWVKQGHKVEFRPLPEKEVSGTSISAEAQAVIQPEWDKMQDFLAGKEAKASDRKNENEIKREKYPIVVEWSEGSTDENIGFENLEQLEIWLDQIGFTENPDETYIKNKVWFRGMTSYVRIDLSRNDGDFNPQEKSLIEYLIENVSKSFDWQSLSEAKTTIVQDANFTYFKGIQANYENQFKLNKAIEEFLDSRPDDYVYSNEEKEFIITYEGYGGLEKQGATGIGLLFEYYTPLKLIEKMWGLAYKYGFNTGKVLEPSVGVGRFLNYTGKTDVVKGYEINPYSAKICRIIHPKANIILSSFAEHFYKGNVFNPKFEKDFDLVIGNPPYGKMTDLRTHGENSRIGVSISQYEHYFILRGLDCLKSGGLLIYVSTANLATKGYEKIKEKIFEKADLVDCYLLPNTTFKQTKVNTSLIVLRRK